MLAVSTPTIKGHSLIEQNYEGAEDKRIFKMPCPFCEFYHSWQQEYFDMRTELMTCPECKKEYDETYKTAMLQKGKWESIDNNENSKDTIRVGYRLNGFYSPVGFVSWHDIANKYNSIQNNRTKRKTFVNQTMGETWSVEGAQLDEYELLARAEKNEYNAKEYLPDGVRFITVGIDVQEDRLEIEVVGWGFNTECWSLDYVVLQGKTLLHTDIVFKDLQTFLARCVYYKKDNDTKFIPAAVAIDSNYRLPTIKTVAEKINNRGFYRVRGRGYSAARDATPYRKIKGEERFFSLDVDDYKDRLFHQLGIEKVGAGYCHFALSSGNNKVYFEMLTAEEKQETSNFRGFKFAKIRSRNEALDCRVYALAVADISGITRRLEDRSEDEELEPETES